MSLSDDEFAEFEKLQTLAFDRARPGRVRKLEILRFKELAERLGQSYVVTWHWTNSPGEPGVTIDLVQDALDRIAVGIDP